MEEKINSEEEEQEDEIESLNIMPSQVEHFKKVLNILQNEVGYLDVSQFGAGGSKIHFEKIIFQNQLKRKINIFKKEKGRWSNKK